MSRQSVPFGQLPLRVSAFVAALAGIAIALAWTTAWSGGRWYSPFLWPSVAGYALVGGVHGGQSDARSILAAAAAASILYGSAAYALVRLWQHAVRRRASTRAG